MIYISLTLTDEEVAPRFQAVSDFFPRIFDTEGMDSTKVMTLCHDFELRNTVGVDYIYMPPPRNIETNNRGLIVKFAPEAVLLWKELLPLEHFTFADTVHILMDKKQLDKEQAIITSRQILNEWNMVSLLSV